MFRKRKIQQEPLFKSYVFAYVEEAEIEKIKAMDGVVNLLTGKVKPL